MIEHLQLDTSLPNSFTPDLQLDNKQPTLYAASISYSFTDVMPYFLELSVLLEKGDQIFYESIASDFGPTDFIKAMVFCTEDRVDITPHMAMLLGTRARIYGANIVIPYKVIGLASQCPQACIRRLGYHLFSSSLEHRPHLTPVDVKYLPPLKE
jgi:hypothetical protein